MICIIATSKGTCNSHHCSELDILVLLQNHTVLRTTHEGRLRLHVNCAMTNMTYNENYWLRHKWVKVVLYVNTGLWLIAGLPYVANCPHWLQQISIIYCLHDIYWNSVSQFVCWSVGHLLRHSRVMARRCQGVCHTISCSNH